MLRIFLVVIAAWIHAGTSLAFSAEGPKVQETFQVPVMLFQMGYNDGKDLVPDGTRIPAEIDKLLPFIAARMGEKESENYNVPRGPLPLQIPEGTRNRELVELFGFACTANGLGARVMNIEGTRVLRLWDRSVEGKAFPALARRYSPTDVLNSRIFPLSYLRPEAVVEFYQANGSRDGRVYVNKERNLLYVADRPQVLEGLARHIDQEVVANIYTESGKASKDNLTAYLKIFMAHHGIAVKKTPVGDYKVRMPIVSGYLSKVGASVVNEEIRRLESVPRLPGDPSKLLGPAEQRQLKAKQNGEVNLPTHTAGKKR